MHLFAIICSTWVRFRDPKRKASTVLKVWSWIISFEKYIVCLIRQCKKHSLLSPLQSLIRSWKFHDLMICKRILSAQGNEDGTKDQRQAQTKSRRPQIWATNSSYSPRSPPISQNQPKCDQRGHNRTTIQNPPMHAPKFVAYIHWFNPIWEAFAQEKCSFF